VLVVAEKKEKPKPAAKTKAATKKTLAKPRADKTPIPPRTSQAFYIVGIGASAGGLEAFEAVFRNMPENPGMAFVLVPHLDPSHASILPQLVQKCTHMKVLQILDGLKILPNTVYIVPPNKDLAMLDGTLQLIDPTESRAARLPINYFFRSLAQDQKEKAICIVLSGMGTDGALGLRAVKEDLGMAMVQTPETAKYDSMPRSAIETGLADYVLPPEKMGKHLIEYARRATWRLAPTTSNFLNTGEVPDAMQKIYTLLRAQTGHDFSLYKPNTVWRRVERRMDVHRLDHISNYVRYLQKNPREVETLFKELLIGVTRFFRDPEAFEILKEKILPAYLGDKLENDPIRVWVPGCSSGEEAYSVAMIMSECTEALDRHFNLQIFATDIDADAIAVARAGIYPASITADVNPDRLRRFFLKEANTYRVKKKVREMLVFAPHNIIKDPPFTKLDLVCCRNLLIYLDSVLQKKLLPLFHYSLKPKGILFLGSSETIGASVNLFSVTDRKWKIFSRKASGSSGRNILEFPPMPPAEKSPEIHPWKGGETDIRRLAEGFLIKSYAPPSVLINEGGDIQYVHGRTGKYLEPAPGEARFNILDMAREGLRVELSRAVRKAIAEKQEVVCKGLRVRINGDVQSVDLFVKPVSEPGASARRLLMVMFKDVGPGEKAMQAETKGRSKNKSHKRLEAVEQELRWTKESLQSTIEELETINEALSVTNEELQSTNEELQSANEELETSKEEQQSLNEELETVNTELQSKMDEVSRVNDDMRNLLNSTEIPTIFLDNELKIKRFTSHAAKLVHLIQSDIGRPISHVVSNLKYGKLAEDAEEVLRKPGLKELELEGKDGRWYLMRILPYRTIENAIDGVVVSFLDIYERKTAAEKIESLNRSLQEARDYAEAIIATLREPLLVLNENLRVISANRSFYRTFQVNPGSTEGRFICDLGNGQWDMPGLRELLEKIIPENNVFEDYEVEHQFPDIGFRKMRLNARKIATETTGKALILLAIEDVTASKS
jgi:two-component system, chemotaxis family, CheB/CheR fusion protein